MFQHVLTVDPHNSLNNLEIPALLHDVLLFKLKQRKIKENVVTIQ